MALRFRSLGEKGSIESIPITAIREDEIPGTHAVTYNSSIDSIEIKHTAKSRKGLALGAVMAAEYLHDKRGFYTMDHLMNSI